MSLIKKINQQARWGVLGLCLVLQALVVDTAIAANNDEKIRKHGIPDAALFAFSVNPNEANIRTSGQATFFSATAVATAIGSLRDSKTYVSVMWSPGSDPTPEELAKFKKTLVDIKKRNPKAILRHGFPDHSYLDAQGWKTGVVDAINEVYPVAQQRPMWGFVNYSESQWTEIIDDEPRHEKLKHEMRTKYFDELEATAGDSKVYVLGDIPLDPAKRATLSDGIRTELDMLERYNIPYTSVPELGVGIKISAEEVNRLKKTGRKAFIKKVGGLIVIGGGVWYVAQNGIKLYLGSMNFYEDMEEIILSTDEE